MKKALPLILSIFSVVLFTVSAITLYCGGFMNPFPPKVKTVEAFQRDLEPTIIAARNELLTAENFMAYKNGYQIDTYSKRGETICSFQSRTFSSLSWTRTISATPTTSTCCPSDSNSPNNAGHRAASNS